MPAYIIRAVDGSHMSVDIDSDHVDAIFDAVKNLQTKDADVLTDDVYVFSVRLDDYGVWSIFLRDHSLRSQGSINLSKRV